MNTPLDEPCLVAELKMLSVSESGNSSPVFSGWRPLLRYDSDPDDLILGQNTVVLDNEKLCPDQSGRVVIRLFQRILFKHIEFAIPNATFKLMDGASVRATGTVIELLGISDESDDQSMEIVG
jgi:hypothetical protein